MSELMINKLDRKIEMCVIENGLICEMYVHDDENKNIMGNIYWGTVQNVVDGMQAAFVNIGLEKNAFISVKDASPKIDIVNEKEEYSPISDILKVGQKILVQVKKIPIQSKGARVSTHITLPGKYAVLMPNVNIITVSQKIENKTEKNRILEIAKNYLPKNFGAILRTDANGISKDEIENDLENLLNIWKNILENTKNAINNSLIYDEHEIISKISRDLINQQTDKIYVNDKAIYEKICKINFNKKCEIVYEETNNIFEKYGLNSEVENIEKRKIWLKCGGYIVIDKTEALTAIDVNSGKYTGDTNLEETALNVNKEAACEIMKQIRLRDIGGIIIIDYIDLIKREDQEEIINIMQSLVKNDKSKIDIKGYTELNLVELTRKKKNL